MNAHFDQGVGPVVLGGAEAIVLHPRYHAMRVEALEPEYGIFVLTPIAQADSTAFEEDGAAGLLVVWIGDLMEQVHIDQLIAVDRDAVDGGVG